MAAALPETRDAPTPPGMADLWAALPVPALLLGAKGQVARANPAAELFFNQSEAALVERGWEGLFPEDSPVRSLLPPGADAGADVAAYDLLLEFVGGKRARADVLVARLPEHPDWRLMLFPSRAAARLVERQTHQRGAARSAVAVAAMLAHEIRNPLAGIRGAAQLLAGGSAEAAELSDLIVAEVDRIGSLIDRMEDFTDTRTVARTRENIHAILGHVRRILEVDGQKKVVFREYYDPSLPPVLANRDQLVQAFLNLAKNAVEASPDGGTVVLATAFRQGLRIGAGGAGRRVALPLEVTIADEGEGPPAHIVDHLFEPFVSARPGGRGLGLALVAKLIGDHGGMVEHDRRHGRTIFRVLLPLAPEEA